MRSTLLRLIFNKGQMFTLETLLPIGATSEEISSLILKFGANTSSTKETLFLNIVEELLKCITSFKVVRIIQLIFNEKLKINGFDLSLTLQLMVYP